MGLQESRTRLNNRAHTPVSPLDHPNSFPNGHPDPGLGPFSPPYMQKPNKPSSPTTFSSYLILFSGLILLSGCNRIHRISPNISHKCNPIKPGFLVSSPITMSHSEETQVQHPGEKKRWNINFYWRFSKRQGNQKILKKKTLFSPLPCHKRQFLILKSSSPNKNLSLH